MSYSDFITSNEKTTTMSKIMKIYCPVFFFWGGVTTDGIWTEWLDLLTTCIRQTELQVITALSLISTTHSSPQHPLSTFKTAVSSPVVPWQRLQQWRFFSFPCSRPSFTDFRTRLPVSNFLLNSQSNSLLQLSTANYLVAISSQLFCQLPTVNSRASLNSS
jgi:hypothetical protein